jgi:ABC-type multidrug transport system fused ATPase/permease subunit
MQAFQTINEESFRAGLRQVQVFAVFMPIMEFMSALAVAFAIWYGGGRILQEELTLGSLVAFISYLQMFFKPIRDISEKYNIMQSAMASSERIFEFMDHQEEIPQPAKAVTPVNPKGAISFENVTFGYEANRPVLHDVSFDLRPGEMAAVVGQTGSGKSTLVHLLERFADPDAGRILMDGVDLREWSHRELRRRLALVTQDVFLFAGTSEENIAMGRAGLDRQAVRRAAEQVNALGFIERLEQGFDQEIGEGGSSLSAGQRQLLSFARALAGDPPVLILDEATSSVDPETERLIQEAIARMSRRRTTLVIAHRLSTIREADQILVMHQGRICERGTHDELMAEQGVYFKLNRLWEV